MTATDHEKSHHHNSDAQTKSAAFSLQQLNWQFLANFHQYLFFFNNFLPLATALISL